MNDLFLGMINSVYFMKVEVDYQYALFQLM